MAMARTSSALPGGSGRSDGSFSYVGSIGIWWSATEHGVSHAYNWGMFYNDAIVGRGYYDKTGFFSVRCVKD